MKTCKPMAGPAALVAALAIICPCRGAAGTGPGREASRARPAPGTLRVKAAPGKVVTRTVELPVPAKLTRWSACCVASTPSGKAGKVLRSGTLPQPSFDVPVFDGKHIVFEGGAPFYKDDFYHRSWIWKVDPMTFKTVDRLRIDKPLGLYGGWDKSHSHSYLQFWDGRYFWFRQWERPPRIKGRTWDGATTILRALDWKAKKEVAKLKLAAPRYDWSLAGRMHYSFLHAENAVWILERDLLVELTGETEVLYLTKIDPATGKTLRRVRLPEKCRNPDGLPAKGRNRARHGGGYANGSFWVHTWTPKSSTCFQIDARDGKILAFFPAPLRKWSWGLAHDGRGGLIMGAAASRKLYIVDSGQRVWMRGHPLGGGRPEGGRLKLELKLEADLTGPGTHGGTVRIHTDDPGQPLITVPVEFVVSGASSLNRKRPKHQHE